MFDRFTRYLVEHGLSLTTFGTDHVDSFLAPGGGFAEDTTTRIRYAKLIDRLCRHLVDVGIRSGNPGFDLLRRLQWPDEPEPVFLREDADACLQLSIQPRVTDDVRQVRNKAVVAFLLGTGVTATEFLRVATADVRLVSSQPYVTVIAHGPRPMRTVQIEQFALPSLETWLQVRSAINTGSPLLFPNKNGKPFTVAMVGNIVRDALLAIHVQAEEMSPRLLRNTDCRRRLLAGCPPDEVSYRLGLVSPRTVERMIATLKGRPHVS
ncbi:tyrosine-type recombinase/integrase [Pararobbsia alpina]|uniref:Tyrosine recombinase XerC n=1 Tax=Pararobbsia alpina TaxID=621374 RepID=A0A6S7C2X2_9BURK|nr:tyrosine-type recombinase/integrase [Pararobbsia alpina]CAB3808176.1 Tyrosine recombinase XerC [Pararobbsia alpina]